MELKSLAQMSVAFSQSLLSYTLNGSARPFSASFAVTNRCNLRCSYCNFPYLDSSHLDLKQINHVFAQLKSLGVRRLGLLGGEPLVRPDIADIVKLAKSYEFYVSLNSNLLLYPKFSSRLTEVDFFFTSLDGSPEVHEQQRGVGSYKEVIESIKAIIDSGRPLVAICVVTGGNLDQADYLLEQAATLGFKVHFQVQCMDTEIVRGEPPPSFEQEALHAFWKKLWILKKNGGPIASSIEYLKALMAWKDFRVSAFYDSAHRCAAGRGFLFVDPHGNAYPCAYTKGKTAPINLLEESWKDRFSYQTPCTQCCVGPMLEFNLLYWSPFKAATHALGQYK